MKAHDPFDDWLKRQVDNAQAPNPDAYWKKTSQKVSAKNGSWTFIVPTLLLLLLTAGGALYYFTANDNLNPIKEDKNIGLESNEEGGVYDFDDDNNDDFDLDNDFDLDDDNLLVRDGVELERVIKEDNQSTPTGLDDTSHLDETTNKESFVQAPDRIEETSDETLQTSKSNTEIAKIAKTDDKEIIAKTSDKIAAINTVATSEYTSETPQKAADTKQVESARLQEEDETGESPDDEGFTEEKDVDADDKTDVIDGKEDSKVVILDEEEKDDVAKDVENDEDEEEIIPEILKKIADQPKWSAYSRLGGGILLPVDNNIMPALSLDLGASYDFSPSWSIQFGVAITGLSNLNQSYTVRQISYDFDVNESGTDVTFRDALYLQIPIGVQYRLNRHAFSAGVLPGVFLDGRATFTGIEDGIQQSTWGYNENIQQWNIAIGLSYDYSISKDWQMGLSFYSSPFTIFEDTKRFQYIQIRMTKWW